MVELLAGFPVVISIPVAWGEMDSFQHVNNAVYFRYFESARIAYFGRVGLAQASVAGIGPILHSTRCRFRVPLTFPDTAQVAVRIPELGNDRFTMRYRLVSEKLGVIAAEAEALIVTFDYRTQTKALMPPDLREAILAFEAQAGNQVQPLAA